ncbi:hypothetical protein ABT127_25925 [Streptomyces sp. NPDC001904]|uniref:hypothetical protein n=1 Tax=Streptomyces sp. NPDC001904 TaxID=3154531 RepID=UPI003326B8E4
MVSDTYSRIRTPERRRAVTHPSPVSTIGTTGTTDPTGTVPLGDHERHDTTQMWSWSATAVMWGYGPSVSDFL